MLAAATGRSSQRRKICSGVPPSSASTTSAASVGDIGAASACSTASACWASSGSPSAMKLTSWPTFISTPFISPSSLATSSAVRMANCVSSSARRSAGVTMRRARLPAKRVALRAVSRPHPPRAPRHHLRRLAPGGRGERAEADAAGGDGGGAAAASPGSGSVPGDLRRGVLVADVRAGLELRRAPSRRRRGRRRWRRGRARGGLRSRDPPARRLVAGGPRIRAVGCPCGAAASTRCRHSDGETSGTAAVGWASPTVGTWP